MSPSSKALALRRCSDNAPRVKRSSARRGERRLEIALSPARVMAANRAISAMIVFRFNFARPGGETGVPVREADGPIHQAGGTPE